MRLYPRQRYAGNVQGEGSVKRLPGWPLPVNMIIPTCCDRREGIAERKDGLRLAVYRAPQGPRTVPS
jgi:hypothetical protein